MVEKVGSPESPRLFPSFATGLLYPSSALVVVAVALASVVALPPVALASDPGLTLQPVTAIWAIVMIAVVTEVDVAAAFEVTLVGKPVAFESTLLSDEVDAVAFEALETFA